MISRYRYFVGDFITKICCWTFQCTGHQTQRNRASCTSIRRLATEFGSFMMAENRNKPSQSSHHCNIPRFMYGLPSPPSPGPRVPPPLFFMTRFCVDRKL